MKNELRQIAFFRTGSVFLCCALLTLFLLFPGLAFSAHNTEVFRIGRSLPPGSGIRFSVPNGQIESVEALIRRESGSRDTFVNLRFEGDQTFENGKRIQVDWSTNHPVSWNVGGASASGRPLVLNAYNGEVYVDEVRVNYSQPLQVRGRYRDDGYGRNQEYRYYNNGGNREYRHDNDYGYNNSPISRRAMDYCRGQQNRRPEIEINRVRSSGNFLSGNYTIAGAVSGSCVEQVGYFENGRLKKRIEMPLDPRFSRNEFEVKVRGGLNGEIRAFTFDGSEDRVSIEAALRNRG